MEITTQQHFARFEDGEGEVGGVGGRSKVTKSGIIGRKGWALRKDHICLPVLSPRYRSTTDI